MVAVKKSLPGFTLVEMIIASVIVAIVAMTAIVIYGGIVRESRRQTVENLTEAAAAAANSYLRRTGSTAGLDSAKLKLYFPNPGDFSVEIHTVDSTIMIEDVKRGISATRHF
jgi:prepilin-type N-terminal cleavage/methylation domain-containing protein